LNLHTDSFANLKGEVNTANTRARGLVGDAVKEFNPLDVLVGAPTNWHLTRPVLIAVAPSVQENLCGLCWDLESHCKGLFAIHEPGGQARSPIKTMGMPGVPGFTPREGNFVAGSWYDIVNGRIV
jgi:hypothetical protein